MMVQALFSQDETLTALETLAAGAKGELILSFRSFAPGTPLLTEPLRELGLATWADLIPWLTRRGVRLFMAFGDEDPLLESPRHRRAWLAASGFANVAQGDAQILCVPHGQQVGALWRWRLRRPLRRALTRLMQDEPRQLTLPQRAALTHVAGPRSQRINQAFAIADGERALIGGFAIDARRDAGPDAGPDAGLWHDVSARVEDADFAGALRAHFADCWTAAIATGAPALATPARPFPGVTRRQSRRELRLLRTLSDPVSGPLRLVGSPRDMSFATQIVRRLQEARHSVYAETSAFRHPALCDALVAAARKVPELNVVMVLHPGADRLPLGGQYGDSQGQAEALQSVQLRRLYHALGPRLTVLTHAPQGSDMPAVDPGPLSRPLPGRMLIIDETYAVLGSHDLTQRSLALDSEASVLIRDPGFASDLLRRRTAHWLGAGQDGFSAATWADAPPPLRRVDARSTTGSRATPLPDLLF